MWHRAPRRARGQSLSRNLPPESADGAACEAPAALADHDSNAAAFCASARGYLDAGDEGYDHDENHDLDYQLGLYSRE